MKINNLFLGIVLIFLTLDTLPGFGQKKSFESLDYDEVSIILNVEKLGYYQMEAIFYEDLLYLPLKDLFSKLGIYVWHSNTFDTVSGYILNKDNSFLLNTNTGQFLYKNKELLLKENQLFVSYSDVYIPTTIYETLFGFTLNFDFRTLTVSLTSDVELPIIKQLRIEKMRNNIKSLTGEVVLDTTYNRNLNYFKGLTFDWNLQLNQETDATHSQILKTALGVELLGGEFNIKTQILRDTSFRFDIDNVKWRYKNDNFKLVKQIEIGEVNTPLYSQITSGFWGIKITNTPSVFNKSYGTYTIQRKTTAGWQVELHINNNLIDFTTADVNGDFSFEIPLVYGNSIVNLKYYGPWGEEYQEEININIPFTFTPHKKIYYHSFNGISSDSSRAFVNQTKVSYGLYKRMTLSMGYEFCQSNPEQKNIFFSSANLVLGNNTLINYTYVNQVMHSLNFLTRSKKNFLLEAKLNYYIPEQTIMSTTNTSETELGINIPIYNKKLKIAYRSIARINFNRSGNTLFSENALTFLYKRINLGVTSITSISKNNTSFLGLNSSIYFKKNWSSYFYLLSDIKSFQLSSVRVLVQKRFNNKFFATSSYSYDFKAKNYFMNLSIYFDLSFMRSSITGNVQKNKLSSSQNFAGSLFFSNSESPIIASNRNSVGRGGVDVFVFLDINHNGIKEDEEPLVKNCIMTINKGQRIMNKNDSIQRFVSLEPFAHYILNVSNSGFPNLSWFLENSNIGFYANPNQISKIFVPVKPMGEIELLVFISKNNKQTPGSRIIIQIFDEQNILIKKGLSDQEGYFTFLGLPPGTYKIVLDQDQLLHLSLESEQPFYEFTINPKKEGDFIDNISIILK